MKRLRWDEDRTPSKHPYRDSAIFNAVLGALIIGVTALTGGNLLPGENEGKSGVLKAIGEIGAILIAAAFFVIATGFNWWRLSKRVEEPPAEEEA